MIQSDPEGRDPKYRVWERSLMGNKCTEIIVEVEVRYIDLNNRRKRSVKEAGE